MGRTEDDVEGFRRLTRAVRFQIPEGRHSRRADFRLAGAALRDDERAFVMVKLALDGLRHGKLGVVQRIPRVFADVAVDGQNFGRQGFVRGVKQRGKLLPDAFRHSDAERVQVARDVADLGETVRIGRCSGDCDSAASQPVFHYGNDVGVLIRAAENPSVNLLPDGNHGELFQVAATLQLVQNIVAEGGNQRHGGLAVKLLKKTLPVPGGTENHALPGRQIRTVLRFGVFRLSAFVGSFRVLFVVPAQKRRLGVHAVMRDLTLVAFDFRPETQVLPRDLRVDGSARVNGVRHSLYHFRVSAEADGAENAFVPLLFVHDGVRVGRKPYLLRGVVVADRDKVAFGWHTLCFSFHCRWFFGRKKDCNVPRGKLQSSWSVLCFCTSWSVCG